MDRCPTFNCIYRDKLTNTCTCYEKTWEHHVIENGKCDHARVRKYVDESGKEHEAGEEPMADKFRSLYREGMVDKEIAEVMGVPKSRVYAWRHNNGYVSNKGRIMEEYL